MSAIAVTRTTPDGRRPARRAAVLDPRAEASRAPPLDLDEVCGRWRLALDAAEDLSRTVSGIHRRLGFGPQELAERHHRLALERQDVSRILDEAARERHVALRRRLSAPRPTTRMLGLPHGVLGCVFDLEGVLIGGAAVHAAAWSETFDELLTRRVERTGERFAPFRPFDPRIDYERHIRGRPRLAGVDAFLASRGIRLPEGRPDDPPGAETEHGLANRKREALVARLERDGVAAHAGSRSYLEAARDADVGCAVVSASAHTAEFLARAGLDRLAPLRIDADAIRDGGLAVEPAPDTRLAACALLGVEPSQAAAFETTAAGVAACRAAGIGFVVAVDRARAGAGVPGADVVVADLGALLDPTLAG